MAEATEVLSGKAAASLTEQLKEFAGSWAKYSALGSFALYVAGYLALRYITLPYGLQLKSDPQFPQDPISIKREEFDAAFDRLQDIGVPMRPDRDQAWKDFAGWRVNYDGALLGLCALVMAPEAPWSSDRAQGFWYLTPKFKTPNIAHDADTQYRERKEAELPNIDGVDTSISTLAKSRQLNERLRRVDPRLLRRPRANGKRGSRKVKVSSMAAPVKLPRKR